MPFQFCHLPLFSAAWEAKRWVNQWPGKNALLYNISLFYCMPITWKIESLRRSNLLHKCLKTYLFSDWVKLQNLLLLTVLRPLQKTQLTKYDIIFKNSRGTRLRILSRTLDHHSVPVMTVKFFDLQFELNSSVIYMDVMIASNGQHSKENPNGRERDPRQDQYMSMHE